MVPHPSEPGVLFIATSGGGVWKTWDGGASWEPITDQLLSWELSGASTARLAGQDVDPGQGGLQVFPTQDTTYQLVARREEGTLTANALVRVGLPPVITAFSASPDPVPRGTATALSWQAPGAQTFSLGGGAGPGYAGPLHGAKVRPLTSTRYTLTATNASGSATRDLDVAVSGPLGSKLVYTDPPSGSEALRLVKSSASTDVGVVLQLVSTGAAPALDGIALNLPLDGAAPGSRDGIARIALSPQSVSFGGLDVTSGSATPAAGLALPGRGLLAGVLTLGMAQKPSAAGGPAGDAPLPAGTVLATFRLDLQPAGGTGLALDGTTGTGFRLRLRSRSGEVAGTVAVGKLEVQ